MDRNVFAGNPNLIELLTPRQDRPDFEEALVRFGERYRRILDFGGVVSIPDNPMGSLHFSALEVLSYLDLPVEADRLLVHLNTFHRKPDLDETLEAARASGVRHLLVVSGDGGPRLAKLEPADLGVGGEGGHLGGAAGPHPPPPPGGLRHRRGLQPLRAARARAGEAGPQGRGGRRASWSPSR